MPKAATMPRAMDDPTQELRAELKENLDRVQALRAALDLNERDQDSAREAIQALEKKLDDQNKQVAAAPALEKRELKKGADELAARIGDYQSHLNELRQNRGPYPGLAPKFSSLENQLATAEGRIKICVAAIVRAHPATAGLIERHRALKAEMLAADQTLARLYEIGSIPARPGGDTTYWARNESAPRPDPAWLAWLAALASDATAELA